MKKNTLIIIGVAGFVIAILCVIIAIAAGNNSGSSSSSSSHVTALIPALSCSWLPVFVAVMCTQKRYPVSQVFTFWGGNGREKRIKNTNFFLSENFKNSTKYGVLLNMTPGKTAAIIESSETKPDKEKGVLKVRFKDGREYTITVVKGDRKSNWRYSAWVIDEITGEEYDIME